MLAAYLISAGLSYEAAIQAIQDANSDVELREAQTTLLRELARE